MIGAMAGDIIGSVHEYIGTKTKDFPLFVDDSYATDDSVLTAAVAEALLVRRGSSSGRPGLEYVRLFHEYFREFPDAGYGGSFIEWALARRTEPYNSWGNGSAMRISPVAWALDSLETVLAEAEICAAVTHNHPEGIRGAQATAAAVYLARSGASRGEIRDLITTRFRYNLGHTLDELRPDYAYDISCMGTVPPAIIAFLESADFEDAIRNAISLGGDADTLACITGSIAEAFYGGVPEAIRREVLRRLPPRLLGVTAAFEAAFG